MHRESFRLIKLTIMEIRAVGRFENPSNVLGTIFSPLIDIGLTDLAKTRKGSAPPAH